MLQHDVLAKSIVGGESVLRTSFPATPDLCIRFLVAVVVGFVVEASDVKLVGYMSVQVLYIDVSRDTCMHVCIDQYASKSYLLQYIDGC
jgi:chorismate mutase